MSERRKTACGYSEGEWNTKADFIAECQTCGWQSMARNALGTGTQHARRHKHCVRIEITRVRIVNHEP